MELAPEMRETYATILAFLAVSEPDTRFAHRVFRSALNQLSLEPEWKVYFALWLRMIAGRGGAPVDHDVSEILEDLAQGDGWSAKLAQFASGKLDFSVLMEAASDLGERTEACFYEGARLMASGDLSGARAMFQRVLESNMVNFYEFAMAQELIAQTIAASTSSTAPPHAQSPAKATGP
jgi:lipoprotein NlpI